MSLGPVLDAALAAQSACESIGLEFCVIGGLFSALVFCSTYAGEKRPNNVFILVF